MKIHKEGYPSIALTIVVLGVLNYLVFNQFCGLCSYAFLILSIGFLFFVLRFFRVPNRATAASNVNEVLAPCDGKVVVIEKVFEPEYFKAERIQVSIFMNPNNVHANWSPIDGIITFSKYHPGKHLVAWHPKSSTENERTSIVFKHASEIEVMCRQIAGAVARRIVHYTSVNKSFAKGDEFGFIKFGSRVDVFLPLDAKIKVQLGQISTGKQTLIAEL